MKNTLVPFLTVGTLVASAIVYLLALGLQQIYCDLQQNEQKSEECHNRIFNQRTENLNPPQLQDLLNVQ